MNNKLNTSIIPIIALDIDDCIYPSNSTYFGRVDDALDILELNMNRIKMMIDKYGCQVYITSSWFMILTLNADGTLSYKNAVEYELGDNFYKEEYQAFKIMKSVLDGNVIGMSQGNRYGDIVKLINHGLNVIALDDMDLHIEKIKEYSDIEIEDPQKLIDNYLFVETTGFITNRITFKIDKFLRTKFGGKIKKTESYKHYQRF